MEENLSNKPEDNFAHAASLMPATTNFNTAPATNGEVAQVNQDLAAAWLWRDTRVTIKDTSTRLHQQQLINNQQQQRALSIYLSPTIKPTSDLLASSLSPTNSSNSSSSLGLIGDFIRQHVNMHLVTKMIAQNLVEILFICVIVTYLVFYFSQISRVSRIYLIII